MNHLPPLPPLWEDAPLRAYLGAMTRRHGVVDTLALPTMRDLPAMRLDKLFVYPQLSTTAVSATTPEEQWPAGLNLFTTLETSPQLVVLGDPGAGKTTLTNWLAWRLSAGLVGKLPDLLEDKLPIPCVLRELQFDAKTTLADLLILVAQRLLGECDSILQTRLQAWVAAKRYVLILDGVDEVSTSRRPVITTWMQQAASDGVVVVATSRLVGYNDAPVDCSYTMMALTDSSNDETTNLSQAEPGTMRLNRQQIMPNRSPEAAWAELRYLMPFDDKRIAAFISNWYLQRSGSEQEAAQKAGDLQTAISKSGTMKELARTPNLLSLMAIVHREKAHLPEGKALLYKEISNAYINTIDQHRKITADDALVPHGWEAREGWLAYVGFKMQCERNRSTRRLEDNETGVLTDEAQVLAWLSEAMQASGVTKATQSARIFLDWVARRSGLLLPRGEGVYAFVHLSFQEYFCACYLLRRVTSRAFIRDTLAEDAPVTKARLSEWGDEPRWQESLIYLLELLASGGDSEAVAELVEILFGELTREDRYGFHQAILAARVFQDRHIPLNQQWKQSLARKTSWFAVIDRSILVTLVGAAYAAIVSKNEVLFGALALPSLNDITNPTDLYALVVADPTVQDLSALVQMPNLRSVNIRNTQVQDISALAKLSHLRLLDLRNTQVQNLSALAGLGNLRALIITKSQNLATSALKAALPNLQIIEY